MIAKKEPTLHIYQPNKFLARRIMHCRTCRCKRRCVEYMSVWLGSLFHCCFCAEDPRDRPAVFKKVSWERRQRVVAMRNDWLRAVSATDASSAVYREIEEEVGGKR
jgi:hypothetical protein